MLRLLSRALARARSEGAWAFAGTLGNALLSLALVKVISSRADVGQFGETSLVLGVVALVQGVALSPISMSHLRLLYTYQARGQDHAFDVAFRTLALQASTLASAIYLLAAFSFHALGTSFYLRHAPLACALLFVQPQLAQQLNWAESMRRQRQVALTVLLSQTGMLVATAVLLRARLVDPGTAILTGQLAGPLLALAIARLSAPSHPNRSIEVPDSLPRELRRAVLRYGWSFPLSWALSWITSTSDRYFLVASLTPMVVGAYAANYGLWSKPFLLLNGSLDLLTRPILYRAGIKGDGLRSRQVVALRAGVSLVSSAVLVLAVALLFDPVGSLLLTSAYRIPKSAAIGIAIGYGLYSLAQCFTPVLLSQDRPHLALIATGVGAAAGAIANFVFIPRFGTNGAALACVIGFGALAVVLSTLGWMGLKRIPTSGLP
jgi:O-antigen/teichoic acid export membrane protein